MPQWETDIRALQARGSDISSWFWDRSGLNMVHRGLHTSKSQKGRGQTIAAWYFEADRFDPFVGPKKHAGRLARPFWETRLIQRLADEQASAWKIHVPPRRRDESPAGQSPPLGPPHPG